MIRRADTVGVFQIESRAQMSMLPRLKPRCFYDLVIEVAIVRPGPIQGGMVHPYLRRRAGEETITYPNERVKGVLERTLGVPLFQEQAMRLAVVAGGFTPGEADQLRRAMGAWRRNGDISRFRTRLIEGMQRNGLSQEFAEQCFQQIAGFGEYGFPESHAASFALLVYVSAWLKRYHPAAFCAALINSQPMGFYQPAQLVRDAKAHGVTVLPVDVNYSGYDCRLENDEKDRGAGDQGIKGQRDGAQLQVTSYELRVTNYELQITDYELQATTPVNQKCQSAIGNRQSTINNSPSDDPAQWGAGGPAVRLGMRLVRGLSGAQVEGIERAQAQRPFTCVADVYRRAGATRATLARLAAADAFRSLGLSRREALWEVLCLDAGVPAPLFADCESQEPTVELPEPDLEKTVIDDYASTGLSLNAHPVGLLRDRLDRLHVRTASALQRAGAGAWMRVAGLVLVRQRPGTAGGIVFCTLEDETGTANLVIGPKVYDRYRSAARGAAMLLAQGRVERQGEVVHLHATRLRDLTDALADLRTGSRDFH